MHETIEVGFHVFVSDGGEEIGAVRRVTPGGRPEIVIWVENGGDFTVPLEAVESVHAQKVVLSSERLAPEVRSAIGHAHDEESPGL